jgi:hypothetical protein
VQSFRPDGGSDETQANRHSTRPLSADGRAGKALLAFLSRRTSNFVLLVDGVAVKFREHRGGLAESMQTVVEVEDFNALLDHLHKLAEPWQPNVPPMNADTVHVEPYGGVDERIGWDTYIVTLKGYGVLGFTDGSFKN